MIKKDALIAVDPGSSSGAIAITHDLGKNVHIADMPDTAEGIWDGFKGIRAYLDKKHGKGTTVWTEVVMENVGKGRPGNSAHSNSTFAIHRGHLEMACVALGFPITWVVPQKWMRELFDDRYPKGPENKPERKRYICEKMKDRWPNLKFKKNQADALAILTWALDRQDNDEQIETGTACEETVHEEPTIG